MKKLTLLIIPLLVVGCKMANIDYSNCDACVDLGVDSKVSVMDISLKKDNAFYNIVEKYPSVYKVDNDKDGYTVDLDCNDNDASIYPGAKEYCDGKDNNCDGDIDNAPIDAGDFCGINVGECKTGILTCVNAKVKCLGAILPQNELCDGKDNDCDGQVDEDWPDLGKICQLGIGECSSTGNYVCNSFATKLYCNAKIILPKVEGPPGDPTCYDGKDNDCNGFIDWQNDPSCITCKVNSDCNDNNVCTQDICSNGVCQNKVLLDGTNCSDGVYCNGLETCKSGICKFGINVLCDDGNSCTVDSCNEQLKKCTFNPIPVNGTEGIPGSASCIDGQDNDCDGLKDLADPDCQACNKNIDCNDNNSCTNDICTANKTCINTLKLNNTSCSDGVFCNGLEKCQNGTCVSGNIVSCDDGNSCTNDSCNEIQKKCDNVIISGCKICQLDSDCNDSNTCTQDKCINNKCSYVTLFDNSPCDDGSYCSVNDKCKNGQCFGEMRDCSNFADLCNNAICDESTYSCKKIAKANGTSCSDGIFCNGNEYCQSGVCQNGTSLICNDNNICTQDICDEVTKKCIFTNIQNSGLEGWAIVGSCSDGEDNDCDGLKDYIDPDCRQCQNNSDCNDNNSCTQDICNTSNYTCQHTNLSGNSCDDGQWCTIGDYCTNGYCISGGQRNCNPGYCDESLDSCIGNNTGSGCADGTREGFVNDVIFDRIAGCSGAWRLPGLTSALSGTPASGCPSAGNDSSNVYGYSCNAANLCANGWRICLNSADVQSHLPSGYTCYDAWNGNEKRFFATRQSSLGNGYCNTTGTNDVYGCGNIGDPPQVSSCGILNVFGSEDCNAIANIPGTSSLVWDCATSGDTQNELELVKKLRSELGGVLCCKY